MAERKSYEMLESQGKKIQDLWITMEQSNLPSWDSHKFCESFGRKNQCLASLNH